MSRIMFKRISEARHLAGNQTGLKWEVTVIKAGLSHNLCPEGHWYFYDPARLQEAMSLFDGVPANPFEFSPKDFNNDAKEQTSTTKEGLISQPFFLCARFHRRSHRILNITPMRPVI